MRNVDHDDLQYAVEQWSKDGQDIERILSKSVNAIVAKAAYDKAAELYPGQNIKLRQVCRLIAETMKE